jgi:methylenetetrahydrofolate reductase (NADPH)
VENRLREALDKGRFAVTVELVTPERARPLPEALAPSATLAAGLAGDARVAALGVTDRVRSDDDHDPVRVAAALARVAGTMPLVHLSGKDRTLEDVARSLGALEAAGLANVLCITGDWLKAPPAERPVRYVDSVHAVQLARRLLPGALVAAGVSPFKYTEEETLNQYFKMRKKHGAGADLLVTQVGWDLRKLAELAEYRRRCGLGQPVLASLMGLSAGGARYLCRGTVPGVVLTEDLVALTEREAQAPDNGRGARLDRLALQLVAVERLGYAGAQLSGLATADDVRRVLDLAEEWRDRLPSWEACERAWNERLRLPGGRVGRTHPDPAYYLFDVGPARAEGPTAAQLRRYRALRLVNRALFTPESPLTRLARPLARRIAPGSRAAAWLARVERRVKAPLFGCRMCGDCRMPATFYVCPETCPKGLATGPCGGSAGNICEAGDRECIHTLQYRLAKATGRLPTLARTLTPPVPEPRGGSSWLAFFAGRAPEDPARAAAWSPYCEPRAGEEGEMTVPGRAGA